MEHLLKKLTTRNQRGGALTLIVAIGLGVLLVVLFLAVTYTQQFTHQKEAQTGIDSAALAVAKEISLVTVRDPNLGLIGVTDQFQAGGPQQQLVYGINTLVGRARLDAVISRALSNDDMLLLANRDSQQVLSAARSLRTALVAPQGQLNYTGPNGAVSRNLQAIAALAYNSNPTRAENSPDVTANDVTVEIGFVNNDAAGLTDIPIPSPESLSQGASNSNFSGQINDQKYYKAGVNSTVPGVGGQYVFSAIGRQPRLVDRQAFTTGAPNPNLVATVVRVSINQKISRTDPRAGTLEGTKREVSCAAAGGERLPTTAGLFRVEFPQGVPQDQSSGDNFRSILAIMNAPITAWSGQGDFFTAQGGPFPGNGRVIPAQFPSNTTPGSDPRFNPRRSATPGQSLSYYIYDWLRNDGLRPNVQSVVNALSSNLRTSASVSIADAGKSIFDQAGEIIIQKAWAQATVPGTTAQCGRIWGAIYDIIPNSTDAMKADPRSLNKFPEDRNAYTDQGYVFRMQASAPQQVAFTAAQPNGKSAIAIGFSQETGCPTTTNGFPLDHITSLRTALGKCNDVALKSYEEAERVREVAEANKTNLETQRQVWRTRGNAINNQIGQIDAILYQLSLQTFSRRTGGYARAIAYRNQLLSMRAALAAQLPPINAEIQRLTILYNEEHRKSVRAVAVERNAIIVINDINALINNLLAVSSIGIQKISETHYKLAESIDYRPITITATQDEIRGFGAIPDGIDDWQTLTKVFSSNPANVAQISCPPGVRPNGQARNITLLSVGDSSFDKDKGAVMYTVSNEAPTNHVNGISPYNQASAATYRNNVNNFQNVTGVSALLEKQSQFQDLNGYGITSPCDPDVMVYYSFMGQDNGHNLSDSKIDLRSEKTKGNKLDCGRAQANSEQQPICDNEEGRWQCTTPALRFKTKLVPYPVPKLPAIQYQPPAFVNYPGPPPAPPRQGH